MCRLDWRALKLWKELGCRHICINHSSRSYSSNSFSYSNKFSNSYSCSSSRIYCINSKGTPSSIDSMQIVVSASTISRTRDNSNQQRTIKALPRNNLHNNSNNYHQRNKDRIRHARYRSSSQDHHPTRNRLSWSNGQRFTSWTISSASETQSSKPI